MSGFTNRQDNPSYCLQGQRRQSDTCVLGIGHPDVNVIEPASPLGQLFFKPKLTVSQTGPARTLLFRWAPQSRNLVLFPSTATQEGTLAARVLAAAADGAPADSVTLRFTLAHREPLEVRAPLCFHGALPYSPKWRSGAMRCNHQSERPETKLQPEE